MTTVPALSVLDLVPVRTGQTSAQAIAASLDLARRADELGLRRYWYAEHHNMPSVASTTPPVLAAAAAARTRSIRVGSGGVMLPNHAPLVVAEQFAALEAIAPGRIDLGIGRAPGSDPIITQLLRRAGTTSEVAQFPDHVQEILALVSPQGATAELSSGTPYVVHATPAATASPTVWLLGSSDYSAQLAAAFGLPYVFANHFSGDGLERALELYRGRYRPSQAHPEPVTFLTVNAVVAPTREEAEARALPQIRSMARLRTGRPPGFLETVEQAAAAEPADRVGAAFAQRARDTWFLGTPAETAAAVRAFADRYAVDEVMVSPVAGAYDGEPMDAAGGRAQTLELLAGELSSPAPR